jgi:hypothetical protein
MRVLGFRNRQHRAVGRHYHLGSSDFLGRDGRRRHRGEDG